MLKYSRQRECIKEYLMNNHNHPTADMVYQAIREQYPHISLGTVYRNLTLLADTGEITRIGCDGAAEHFDGNIKPHYHFICRKCGKIQDLAMQVDTGLNNLAQHYCCGRIESSQTFFYGRCDDCLKEETESPSLS